MAGVMGAALTLCPFPQCSVSCGRGVQRRSVQCHSSSPTAAEEAECDPASRPPLQRDCHLAACPTHRWAAGQWQAVSGDPFARPGVTGLCSQPGMLLDALVFGLQPGGCQKKKKKIGRGKARARCWLKGGAEKCLCRVNLLLRAALCLAGTYANTDRFWVGIWVSSSRQNPAVLLQPEPCAWRN